MIDSTSVGSSFDSDDRYACTIACVLLTPGRPALSVRIDHIVAIAKKMAPIPKA